MGVLWLLTSNMTVLPYCFLFVSIHPLRFFFSLCVFFQISIFLLFHFYLLVGILVIILCGFFFQFYSEIINIHHV